MCRRRDRPVDPEVAAERSAGCVACRCKMRQLYAESESALRVSPSGIGLEVGWHDVSFHLDLDGRVTKFSLG